MSFLSIGVTALNAAQLGLLTTEHNIANASTVGYNRQRIGQAANIPLATGSGFVGQGTHVDSIRRVYNEFITNQVNQSQTVTSELSAYYDQIKLIDNMLADPNAGLSPALQDFFRGVQTVAASPASAPARQAMVSSAEALVSRFQSIDNRLSELYDSVDGQIQSTISGINSLATQIAELNQRIVVAEAAVAQPANDLLDQRDQLVAELNTLVRVNTVTESDGSYSVFIGNGQQLVIGTRANSLVAVPSYADPERMTVGITNGNTTQQIPENIITGGSLSGLLRFRSESLDRAANSLGQIATSIALTFNAQHDLGQDLLGNVGAANIADFFNLSSPKVVANQLNLGDGEITATFVTPPPMRLNDGAFSLSFNNATGTYTVSQMTSGGGSWSSADLSALMDTVETATGQRIDLSEGNFFTQLTGSDYRLTFNGGTNYTLTRLSDNTAFGPADLATLNGLIGPSEGFTLSAPAGTPQVNDSFLIQPTREVARNIDVSNLISADPRRIATALPVVAQAPISNLGSGRITFESLVPGATAPTAGSPVTLTFDGAVPQGFTVTGVAPGTNVAVTTNSTTTVYASPATIPYTPDALITVNGMSFRVSGTPQATDQFTLSANVNGIADGRNALALGQLQTQLTMEGATSSFQGAYGQLVSDVGNKTREVRVTRDAQQKLLEQAQAAREAQSGVNLDEEAANLLKYQQAYQAAARIMDVGNRLFDELLSIAR